VQIVGDSPDQGLVTDDADTGADQPQIAAIEIHLGENGGITACDDGDNPGHGDGNATPLIAGNGAAEQDHNRVRINTGRATGISPPLSAVVSCNPT